MSVQITLNGQAREVPLAAEAAVSDLLDHLELKGDRIAVEQNGTILPRSSWNQTVVHNGDRFEIVHFVGGGTSPVAEPLSVSPSSSSSQRCP